MNRVAVWGHIISNCTVGDGGRGVDAMNCVTMVGSIASYCAVGDGGGRVIAAEDPTAAVSCYYTVCDSRRRGVDAVNRVVVDLAILNSKSRQQRALPLTAMKKKAASGIF